VAFIAYVLCAVALELGLRKTRFGMRLRGVGSDEEAARRVGAPVNRTVLLGYVGASLLTLLGAVVLLAQLGVGDPGQGTGYTLTSITAVVLGGTSLLGGRGTFIGTLMGAGLNLADRDREDPAVRAHAVRARVGVRRHGRRGAVQRAAEPRRRSTRPHRARPRCAACRRAAGDPAQLGRALGAADVLG